MNSQLCLHETSNVKKYDYVSRETYNNKKYVFVSRET